MKMIIVILILLNSSFAREVTWLIGGEEYTFKRVDPAGYLLSQPCGNGVKMCMAAKEALKPRRKLMIGPGGKNPGSLACVQAGGAVVIGRTEEYATQGFCLFSDKSLVSISAF